jgi:hypothetical protein
MPLERRATTLRGVQTYAVYWTEPDGSRFAGSFSLGAAFALLEGGAGDGRRTRRRIDFGDILGLRYDRGRLHIWSRDAGPVRLGSVDGPGALGELASYLQARVLAV